MNALPRPRSETLLASAGFAGAGAAVAAAPIASALAACAASSLALTVAILRRAGAVPRRPEEWLAAAAVVSLPLAPFLNTYGPYGTLLRCAIGALLVLLLAMGAVDLNRELPRTAKALIVAFCVYQAVAVVGAPALSYGLLRAANWLVFVPFAFIRFRRDALRVLAAFALLSGLVLAAGAALQAAGLLGGTWGGFQLGERQFSRRYTSFLLNPNDFGLAMLIVSLTALAAASRRHGSQRMVLVALAAGCGVLMLASSSRGALVAAAAVVLLVASSGARRALAPVAAVLAAAIVVTLIAAPPLRDGFARTMESFAQAKRGQEASLEERTQRWASVLGSRTAPVLGGGYGRYAADEVSGFSLAGRHDAYRAATIDSSWLKLWLEEGVAGTALLAGVLWLGIAAAWRPARRGHDAAGVVAGGILIALVVRSTTVDVFDINPWNFTLWLALGVAFSLGAPRAARGGR